MSASVVLLLASLLWASTATASRRTAAAAARGRLGAPSGSRPVARPRRATTAQAVGAVAVGLGAVVSPIAGAGVMAALVGRPVLQRRRARRRAVALAVAALPDTVDLLAVAARAGLPAPAAVAAVAERAPPPWDVALCGVAGRTRRGERFVDALVELTTVGGGDEVSTPLRAVLRSAVDDGADLAASLERLAVDARDLRRRRAEEAARRVPVRLLLPLVACSLPAFALLTIVPILAGALDALGP